ncbi:CAP domain-containing protein [Zopfochytrium polystomum]|nr:CAP domain-containing protein [Zopfochytrium polystomum]
MRRALPPSAPPLAPSWSSQPPVSAPLGRLACIVSVAVVWWTALSAIPTIGVLAAGTSASSTTTVTMTGILSATSVNAVASTGIPSRYKCRAGALGVLQGPAGFLDFSTTTMSSTPTTAVTTTTTAVSSSQWAFPTYSVGTGTTDSTGSGQASGADPPAVGGATDGNAANVAAPDAPMMDAPAFPDPATTTPDAVAPAVETTPDPVTPTTADTPTSTVAPPVIVSETTTTAPQATTTAQQTTTQQQQPQTQTTACKSCGVKFSGSKTDYLASHNFYRSLYSLPALTQSDKLAADAASALAAIPCGQLIHQNLNGEGENLYLFGATNLQQYGVTIGTAIDSWMEEDTLYFQYGNNGLSPTSAWNNSPMEVGHFTQIVWSATTQVGCATLVCDVHTFVAGCRYSGPGNVFLNGKLLDPFTNQVIE